jgi:hypothetical protein
MYAIHVRNKTNILRTVVASDLSFSSDLRTFTENRRSLFSKYLSHDVLSSEMAREGAVSPEIDFALPEFTV